MVENVDYNFKFVVIGEAGVGKSSLIKSLFGEKFDTNSVATIGVDFRTFTTSIQRRNCKVTVWDTAGDAHYRAIVPQYYRGSQGIVLVYAINSRDSFDAIPGWLSQVQQNARDFRVILVGNKADIDDSERAVSREEAEQYATENGFLWLETSAKCNSNVVQAFTALAQDCMNNPATLASQLDLGDSFYLDNRALEPVRPGWCSWRAYWPSGW